LEETEKKIETVTRASGGNHKGFQDSHQNPFQLLRRPRIDPRLLGKTDPAESPAHRPSWLPELKQTHTVTSAAFSSAVN
jgi:hypothetical protein